MANLINPNTAQPLGGPNQGTGTDQGDSWNTAAGKLNALMASSFTTYNVAGPATLPVGAVTGAGDVSLLSTNAAPGTQTTRTAAQLIADGGLVIGQSYNLRIANSGAGTFTLAGGTGVTLGTGTNSVATATFRDYVVTVNSASAITIQTTGNGSFT